MSPTDIIRLIGDISSIAVVPLFGYVLKIYNAIYDTKVSVEKLRAEIYANFELRRIDHAD